MCKEKIYKSMPWVKGQVWLVDEPKEVTEARMKCGTFCQVKTRPYLIYLSNQDARLNFNVVQAFPISTNARMDTQGKTFYDFDIRFVNHMGDTNRIITGQLTTIDVRYIRKYLCTLPDELLQEIDNLLMRRFGIGGSICQMNQQIMELERRLAELKGETRAVFDEFNYEVDINGSMNPTSLRKKEDEKARVPQVRDVVDPPVISYTKTGRIRWDDETLLNLLADIEKYGDRRTAERWGFSKSQLSSKKCYAQKKLAAK